MNDTDLCIEAYDCDDSKDKRIQKIGGELHDLYFRVYNEPFKDEAKQKIVDEDTWGIYSDIWNGMTFEECINKRRTDEESKDKGKL